MGHPIQNRGKTIHSGTQEIQGLEPELHGVVTAQSSQHGAYKAHGMIPEMLRVMPMAVLKLIPEKNSGITGQRIKEGKNAAKWPRKGP